MSIDVKKKYVSDEELEVELLYKLHYMRIGRKRHTYEPDLPKGFPSHLRNRVLKIAEELRRRGFLIKFPHSGEMVWQLNLDKIQEIKDRIRKYYDV